MCITKTYTARDGVHFCMDKALDSRERLPINIEEDNIIYYVILFVVVYGRRSDAVKKAII